MSQRELFLKVYIVWQWGERASFKEEEHSGSHTVNSRFNLLKWEQWLEQYKNYIILSIYIQYQKSTI